MLDAVVLSQGDEVVTGQIADTNAAWLSDRLTTLGIRVVRHVTVGDRLADIRAVFEEAARLAPIALCTGGLGPTADDLTAEALAAALGVPLALDAHALATLTARYAALGRPMATANRKQAMLPQGATRLDNDRGTAPGFSALLPAPGTAHGHAYVACMPGVPHEMRAMYEQHVEPALQARFPLTPGRLVVLRIVGKGESDIQDRIEGLAHPGIILSTRTFLAENHLKLRVAHGIGTDEVAGFVSQLRAAIGPSVYAIDGLEGAVGGTLAATVGRLLRQAGHTVALAESCTGGQLAAACTAVPGASTWFEEGVCTYSNAAKIHRLGVPSVLIGEHGAVSEPVARAMAEAVRDTSGATWGVGVTGIAGPGGGTPDKPVGTVHVAIAGPVGPTGQGTTTHRVLRLPGDRARVQSLTVSAALALLRRALLSSSAEPASAPSPSPAPAAGQPPRS